MLGLVHPLYDISASVDAEFLARYDLAPDNGVLAGDEHKTLLSALAKGGFEMSYRPGGATQNSIRVAQWYLGERHATTCIGCIGRSTVICNNPP